jgi:hypothetical protein
VSYAYRIAATAGTKGAEETVKISQQKSKMSSRSLRSKISSLTAEDESEAGWDLPSRQPSQSSELMINSDETNRQAEQCEVSQGQEQFREEE